MAAVTAMAMGVAVMGACGGDDAEDAGSGSGGDGVSITGAWARTSPSAVTNGAAYVTITAEDGDVLTGASVDASVAAVTEVHETVMAEGDDAHSGMSDTTMAGGMSDTTMAGGMSDTTMAGGMSDTTMAGGMGAMTMQEIAELVIPAGEAVEMKPGGYHIMLMELAEPLELGSTFTLTLSFENAGDIEVEVPVRDAAP
jgi:periplasmic copper chaperone A